MKLHQASVLIFSFFFLIATANAQVPQRFKYQSIARNASGQVLSNSALGIRLSIHEGTSTGTLVFQETHVCTTNEFGLFTLSIGGGTPLLGTINTVNWPSGAKFIEVEGDLSGGTNYSSFGTTELLSVPYALHAATSGTPLLPNGTQVGNTTFWNGTEWVVDDYNLFNAGGAIGVGTNNPLQKLDINGNITIPLDSSYMINNKKILWARGTGNMIVGNNAGAALSIGVNNSFFGFNAGLNNSVGSQNTFIGTETGVANLDGMMNSFVGRRAGLSNTNGNENTFLGAYAGQSNTEGFHNTFSGVTSGSSNTLGSENAFYGAHAGYFSTLGNNNTFIGNFAGQNNSTGSYNTYLGFGADAASGSISNATAIGYGAIVQANNSVHIGNTAVTNIGGPVSWSTLSDKRMKNNIHPLEAGLDFVLQLKPVTYTYITKGQEGIRYTGLLAQDVEKIMDKMGLEFSGIVRPQNENDNYSIRYAEFVLPLINAVQEQQTIINSLLKRIEALEALDKK
jgi:hypothetical protein